MTCATRSARAASIRNSSAAGLTPPDAPSTILRAASATGVPPGSRTAVTSRPSSSNRAASQRTSVDFPAPSGPSTTTNSPLVVTSA